MTSNGTLFPDGFDFYTIGYQNLTIHQFVELLQKHGIKTLVDIRSAPYSHNESYNKEALMRTLSRNWIDYIHMQSLGNPKTIRNSADWKRGYREHIVSDMPKIKLALSKFSKPICLMCMEADPKECHRRIVSIELTNLGLIGCDIMPRNLR